MTYEGLNSYHHPAVGRATGRVASCGRFLFGAVGNPSHLLPSTFRLQNILSRVPLKGHFHS